ncbi:hypothetical protein Cylst_3780 [Cylindrospermum stagnale PCC 7417]|uniref:Uncharacterized protein n=1 Tax=Cylindrospermum stagnale PCC 7417 TaxID=56107 RepID=K9X1F0_9NOST|nr:hypothetical protein [Cylindrospermum stagnale]AFZ25899.1 hypothetical protein Cylst_3780 [Cylindrospermum stagnale PCC 7417]
MPKTHDILDKNEIASLGASLRAIDQKILKKGNKSGTTRIWFQGAEPYFDVFFELKDNQIIWFQFTLRGKSLSWNSKRPGLQTGNTNELNIDDVSFYAASKTMQNDTHSDLEFINLVKLILQTRTEEAIFTQVLELLN